MTSIARGAAWLGGACAAAVWLRRRRAAQRPPFRHALVTGSSRGLGFALARDLVRRGVAVSLCGRDEETLARAGSLLAPRGRVHAQRCDLTRDDDREALVRGAQEALGPVDLLVNNAAIIHVGPLATMTWDDFEAALRVNYEAAVRLTLAVLPSMRARRFGHVVNVVSIGGRLAFPHLLPYVGSKFALAGFSEGLRAELAGSGVGVTTVCPGLTRTGSPRHALFKGRRRAEHAWFAISDALPVVSGDAHRTARRIVDAAAQDRADLVTTLPARLAAPVHGVLPGTTTRLLGLVNRWILPGPDGAGTKAAPGRACVSAWAPSPLTRLADLAAFDLNQVPTAVRLAEERTGAARADAPAPEGEAL